MSPALPATPTSVPIEGSQSERFWNKVEAVNAEQGSDGASPAETQADSGEPAAQTSTADPVVQPVGSEPAPETPAAEPPTIDALIQTAAKRFQLDLNKSEQVELAKAWAHQQHHIKRIEQENATLRSQTPADPTAHLTPWEKELLAAAEQPAAPVAETKPPQAPQNQQQPQAQPGPQWRSTEDAYKDWNEAWATGDFRKVGDIEDVLWNARFEKWAMPVLARVVETLEARLKPIEEVSPVIQQTVASQREQANRNFAIRELSQVPEFADVHTLFRPASDQTLTFQGEQFDDTPFNRWAMANPDLLEFVENAKDDTAQRKAMIALFRKASRDMKAGTAPVPPGVARSLIDAGAAQAQRQQTQQARQGLNAGVSSPATEPAPEESYITQLQREVRGSRKPFADAFRKS